MFLCHDIGGRRLREDSWTSTATWTMDYRWVGYTVFELKDEAKKEEKEKPASTKNDGGEDESDKRNKEQRSVEGDFSRVYILPSPNGGPLCPCKKHLYAGVP